MRILVTGSEGSLMQAVIPGLTQQGHSILGVDNFCRHGRVDRRRTYEFIEGDLADPAFANKVIKGAQGVVQAAARIYGVGGFHRYPADILAHDVTLHQNVLWAALAQGVPKVCYVSSSMVLERCQKHPSNERDADDSPVPATDYGLSKLVGERLSMAFARQYGMKYVIWRPFNIITPFEKFDREQGISHVFADFIGMIVVEKRNPITILGDGRQVRCFTWIDDIAQAVAEFSFKPVTDNQVFNIGNPEPITVLDLANMIYEEAKCQGLLPADASPLKIVSKPAFDDDVRIRIPDISKAQRGLGWKPTVTTCEAVRRCVANAARGRCTSP